MPLWLEAVCCYWEAVVVPLTQANCITACPRAKTDAVSR